MTLVSSPGVASVDPFALASCSLLAYVSQESWGLFSLYIPGTEMLLVSTVDRRLQKLPDSCGGCLCEIDPIQREPLPDRQEDSGLAWRGLRSCSVVGQLGLEVCQKGPNRNSARRMRCLAGSMTSDQKRGREGPQARRIQTPDQTPTKKPLVLARGTDGKEKTKACLP
jgi:hypothetical protein